MQRRHFLKNSFLSSLGVSLLPGTLIAGNNFNRVGIPEQLLQKFSARKTTYFTQEESLLQLLEHTLAPWKQLGFMANDLSSIQVSDFSYVVSPVHLFLQEHQQPVHSGALFFRKKHGGAWECCGEINQYQCEALLHATDYLASTGIAPDDLKLCLLPADPNPLKKENSAQVIHTTQGSVHTRIKVVADHISIQIQLYQKGALLWKDTIQAGRYSKGYPLGVFA